MEIKGPKIKFVVPVSTSYRTILKEIKGVLRNRLSAIRGILLEDKGLVFSMHYRLAGKKDALAAKKIFNGIISPYLTRDKIKINSGKKVCEIMPKVKWDKGKAVLWLLARERFVLGEDAVFPIYIGDDLTDEDAFKALRKRGLTIFVGRPRQSYAQYYLNNPGEVLKFLKLIFAMRHKRKSMKCRN